MLLQAGNKAVGGHYEMEDGTRVQVVDGEEDGKYLSLTEDRQAAMFLPFLQSPAKKHTSRAGRRAGR